MEGELCMPTLTAGGYVKTSVILHPELLARLERVAADRHLSKSAIVREALGEKLDRMEDGGSLIGPVRVA